jgi:hypothetical protein
VIKRLLLALLKLVLQLLMFALTGKWVKIGSGERPSARAKRAAKPSTQRPRADGANPPRRKVFDRTRPPPRSEPPSLEDVYLELESHLPGAESLPSTEALLRSSEAVRPSRRKRARETPVLAARGPLARALRDRRSLREAIALGTAVAPRRRHPPF